MVEFTSDYQPADESRKAGRNRRTLMTDALMQALHREASNIVGADGKPTKRLNVIADKLAEKAAEGDIQAIKEVFDRTDGKAVAALELGSDPDNPFQFFVHLVKGKENEPE